MASKLLGEKHVVELSDEIDDGLGSFGDIFVFILIVGAEVKHHFFGDNRWHFLEDFSQSVQTDSHGEFRASVVNEMLYDVLYKCFYFVVWHDLMDTLSQSS